MKGRETEQKKIVIALCDDNQAAVWQLKELIQEYFTQKKIEATLLSFFRCILVWETIQNRMIDSFHLSEVRI